MKKLIVLLVLLSLYSCGGNDSSSPTTPPTTPPPPPQSEGSYANPLNLGTVAGKVFHHGAISSDGISFYKFTTASSGAYFIATFNSDTRLSWVIHLPGEPALTLCNPSSSDPYVSSCFTSPLSANTLYYLAVIELSGTAGYFTLGIE